MPTERHRPPVPITTVPRSTLVPVHHKEIDAVLKDLKLCSRRLRAALGSLKDELRVLERLYYKSKNQHRMSLFFKRVPEIRRYGQRLCELDILERVDLLRASFAGLGHTNAHKALKGSWSDVPEKPCVDSLTERLTVCSTLVCKMRERLKSAYRHFMLAMQTGAFTQLVILFVAISSRMSALSSELEEALRLGILTCNRLLIIIHPADVQRLPSELATSRSPYADCDTPLEDTGQIISHRKPIDGPTVVVENSSLGRGDTLGAPVTSPPGQPTCAVTSGGSGSLLPNDHATAHISKKTATKVVQKPRIKKTKKRFDEIDEIFGF